MRTKSKGFTLVELLVVIGIISVLIGILLPSLQRAKKAAVTAQCLSNMRQCCLGFLMYAADNHGDICVHTTFWGNDCPWPNWMCQGKSTLCYLGTAQTAAQDPGTTGMKYIPWGATICPANPYSQTDLANEMAGTGYNGFAYGLRDCNDPARYFQRLISYDGIDPYSYHSQCVSSMQKLTRVGAAAGPYPYYIAPTSASTTVMMGDTMSQAYYGFDRHQYAYFVDNYFADFNSAIQTLHNQNMANVGFYDGHCETLPAIAIYKNTSNHVEYFYDQRGIAMTPFPYIP